MRCNVLCLGLIYLGMLQGYISPLLETKWLRKKIPLNIFQTKIYDEDVHLKLLICGAHCTPDSSILNSLEDGLNALLNIEFRWCKLQDRVSAAPPLHVDSTLLDGWLQYVVISQHPVLHTCHCFFLAVRKPLLEKHIKKELIESRRLVRVVSVSEDDGPSSAEPFTSMSVASGASTFEVLMTLPKWAAQVLKYLAQETSYKSLVPLGIASYLRSIDKMWIGFFSFAQIKMKMKLLQMVYITIRQDGLHPLRRTGEGKYCVKTSVFSSLGF
uniref:Uncharacterized protein n=1 Tax=Oryza meridionalis TaxID=40149 RepID=A0A0E0ECI0_9ORYZ